MVVHRSAPVGAALMLHSLWQHPCAMCGYRLNKGHAADLLRMGIVRVVNACYVCWQPKVKGLKVGIDQKNTTGNKFRLLACTEAQ